MAYKRTLDGKKGKSLEMKTNDSSGIRHRKYDIPECIRGMCITTNEIAIWFCEFPRQDLLRGASDVSNYSNGFMLEIQKVIYILQVGLKFFQV